MEYNAFRKIHPVEFYRKFLSQGLRPDGRVLTKLRKTVISAGSISTAEGSGMVKIGNTSVLCGIKAEVGVPSTEEPNQGKLVIGTELPPLCSPKFQTWQGTESRASTLSSFLNNIIFSTNVLDLSELCIEEEKAVWVIYADIYCLDNDGNMLDAALIALLTALKNLRLPGVELKDGQEVVVNPKLPKKALTLKHLPIPLSFGIIDEYVLVDPTDEEESMLSTALTIVYNNKGHLCSVYKPGGAIVTDAILKQCMEAAKQRASEVVGMINKT